MGEAEMKGEGRWKEAERDEREMMVRYIGNIEDG